jgi:hypothetical protein
MYTLDDSGAKGMSLLDFPAPAGRVVGEAFDAAVETNPIPLFMQSMELNNARARGFVMPKEQAAIQAKAAGVDVKVPDTGITQDALGILIERRRDEAARNLLMARSPGGLATAGTFGAGLAGALLDPVNAAAGFIPVLGGTRYAGVLADAATAGARAGVRLGVGAAEGAVGAAAVEIPTMSLRRDLQDDYSLYDSLANIAFGTMASAGIRGVGGAVRDRVVGLSRARELDALRSIEPEVWQQLRQRAANEQERAFWGDLEAGFQRGEGIPPELRAAMERERNQPEFDAGDGRIPRRSAPRSANWPTKRLSAGSRRCAPRCSTRAWSPTRRCARRSPSPTPRPRSCSSRRPRSGPSGFPRRR